MISCRVPFGAPAARRVTWLTALVVALGGLGCGGKQQSTPSDPEVLANTRPLKLSDGSTLRVPLEARRILPVTSAAVDLLADLGLHDRVVAIPRAAFSWSVAAREPEPWSAHKVLESLEGEAILDLKPDLVLAATWSYRGPLWVALSVHIPVVPLPDADSWEEVENGITLAGKALGVEDRARDLIKTLTERRSTLAGKDRRQLRILSYSNFGAGGHTSGPGTTLDLAVTLAGMENAVVNRGHGEIGLEEILSLNPDVFLTSSGRDKVSPGAEFLRNDPTLAGLEAIQKDRIIVLPAELFSTSSHRILDAAEELARQVDLLFQ